MLNQKLKSKQNRAEVQSLCIPQGFKQMLLLLAGGALLNSAWATNFPDNQGWALPQYGSTMMTGDLNNDGRTDVCGRGAAGIYCALSNGTSFTPMIYATKDFADAGGWNDPRYYSSLRLGDVNGDHFADVCGRAADGIYCALGKGDGTFWAATRWTTYYSDAGLSGGDLWTSSTMMLGDINHDGYADVCIRYAGGIVCSLSQKNGFTPPILSTQDYKDADGWTNPIYYSTLRLADVNGDQHLDLCGRGYAGIICSLGDGAGKFGAAQVWGPAFSNANGWSNIQYAASIAFGDVNGDGKADVCGSSPLVSSAMVCSLSTGSSFPASGGFSGFVNPAPNNAISPSYYGTFRLADIDGDNRADICTRSAVGFVCKAATIAFENLAQGASPQLMTWTKDFKDIDGWNAVKYGTTLMYGDLNNDGKKDMCGRGAAGIYCVLSNGSGFGLPILATSDFSDADGYDEELRYSTLRMADVNGDHFADICSREPDGVWCALGTGDGHFQRFGRWTTDYGYSWGFLPYASTMMLADLNKDGMADVCMRSADGVYCSLSNQTGFGISRKATYEFSDSLGWNNPVNYSTLRLADIDGNGYADICGRGFSGMTCALGNGDGTFGVPTVWTLEYSDDEGWGAMDYASTIMLGDVDGDGKADVCGRGKLGVFCAISTGHSFGSLTVQSWFSNTDSLGNFTMPAYYGSIRVADVTGDHMADLCGRGTQGVYCGTAIPYFRDTVLVQ